ncbi:aminotransferase class V-fold PLP-dependent enzyme [Micromonospora profundi]|uniref:aminotransferase class V-fold PLP-dependent enzyme n=1 Tax=Micromonospora profundi TaxID=1420889 RepID=UPI00366806C0
MTAAITSSVGALRQWFPTLAHNVHLAACSIAPRSAAMEQALNQMLDDLGRPGFWAACEEQLWRARRGFANLIGAHVDQIAVLPSASVAAFQASAAMRWRRRRALVTGTAEFPGLAHVWLARQSCGARVRWCGSRAGQVSTSDYVKAITPRTALVSAPAVSYRDAIRLDVARIAEAAHAAGAKLFVDAYQAAGVMPVNVDKMGCDYLVTGTGKYLLGLPGLAFLYVRDPSGPAPTLTGRFGRTAPNAFDAMTLDFPSNARRLETGTPSAAATYAAVTGLDMISQLDPVAIRQHTQRLIAAAAVRLAERGETVRLASTAEEQGAHLALVEPHAEAMTAWLAHRGLTVAPRASVVRLAMHAYTTIDDIDALCAAIESYRTRSRTRQRTGASR